MSTIPTSVTEELFNQYIEPHLGIAKRGNVSWKPLWKIFNLVLDRCIAAVSGIGCQCLEVGQNGQSVYFHWQGWIADGSLERVWQASVQQMNAQLDLTQMNLGCRYAVAKKGGEAVVY